MSHELLRGFSIGLGLIVAIGAQNAFLLDRAIRRDRIGLVATICVLWDAVLIGMAVTGVGATLAANATVACIASWAGAAFLLAFGARALRDAVRGNRTQNIAGARRTASLRATVLATLAVTVLNPHSFLDAFVLLGGISAPLPQSARYAFGLGAVLASVTWTCALAFAGRRLAPAFRKPITWRVLDLAVAATMWCIAASLLADLI